MEQYQPSSRQEEAMRFYTRTHRHYCGIDLHARTMYVCVLSQEGAVLLHRNLPCNPEVFLATIAPFREDLVVAVECVGASCGRASISVGCRARSAPQRGNEDGER
jgi:hypothetical protein